MSSRQDRNDLLYQVFHDELHVESKDDVSIEAFAILVVEKYLRLLAYQGVHVPLKMQALLEDDLLDDVIDMIRKKTYGHMSILEYRGKQPRKRPAS